MDNSNENNKRYFVEIPKNNIINYKKLKLINNSQDFVYLKYFRIKIVFLMIH